jgi:uncharacterized protein (TIGR03435 family)
MTRIAAGFLAMTLAAAAQPANSPAFDVASIRVGQPGRETIEAVPGSITMRNVRLNAVIRWAYHVMDYQISGPAWLNDVWLDISAKAESPVKDADLRVMMQTLLADRFKLTLHRQIKEIPALILTVGKSGHKLTPVETADVDDASSFKTGKLSLTGQGATVHQLIEFLSREIRNPIIDQTGLAGRYNYALDINSYVTEEMMKSAGPNGGPPPDAPSIIAQAMQAQLGLRLDSKKAPVEMLIIDRVERAPTGN